MVGRYGDRASDLAERQRTRAEDELCCINKQYEEIHTTLIVAPGRPSAAHLLRRSITRRISSAAERTRSFSMIRPRCTSTVR